MALGDVEAAINFAGSHPGGAPSPVPQTERPNFVAPPRPAPDRNVMLEAALTNLEAAFDALGRAPGGDLGGFRAKTNSDIATAAQDLMAGISAANASYRPPPTQTQPAK